MTNDERDPTLQRLFTEARQTLDGEEFTDRVMALTRKRKTKLVVGRIGIGLVLVVLAISLQDVVVLLTQIPVIELDEGLMGELVAPVNHLGALLSLGLILVRVAYRKIFQTVQ